MAKSATLTFGMDLSDFNKAMKAINRQSSSLSDQIGKVTKNAMEAYKKGLKDLKINPFQKAKFHTDLARLKEDIKKATTTQIRLNMEEAKQKILGLKGEMIAAFASVGAVALPVKTAIDFESAMADVKKVVDFDTPQELKSFSNEILKMSQVIPMTAEGLTQVTAAGAQMGISKNELFKFTELAAKTAVAFDITADQAGDSIGKIKNILSLSIDETGEMMDAINHLSNKNAAKASEIVEVMKRIAGIGKQVGVSKEQTAALATSFIALGKAPETAASASEALLKKLNNIKAATPKAKEAFEEMGIDINDFANAMQKDAQGTILKFLELLQKIKPQKRGELLTAIMGTNYDSDIATLVSGIDVYKKALDEVSDKTKFKGSNEAEFKARSATTANSLQMVKNSFTAVGASIGNIFLPYVNSALMAITDIGKKIREFVQNNESLVKNIGIAAVSLIGLKTAFLAAKLASAMASFSLNGYRQILTKLPIDCLKLGGAVNGCNLSYTKLNRTLLVNSVRLRRAVFDMNTYKNLSKGLGSALWGMLKGLAAGGIFFFNGIKQPTKTLKTTFNSLFTAIKFGFRAIMLNPFGMLIATISLAALAVYKFWQPIKAFFSGIWQGIKEGLSPIASLLSEAFAPLKPIFSFISDFFSSIFSQSEATKESLAGFESVGHAVGKAIGAIIDIVTTPLQWIISMIKWVFDFIAGSKAGQWLGEKMGLNLTEADRAELKAMSSSQTTAGSIDRVIEGKQIQNAQNSTKQINDNKKIDIHMHGTTATPQAVVVAVADAGYSFGD